MQSESSQLSLRALSEGDLLIYLKGLWMKQLKLDSLDLSDDFLALGGQSVDLFRMLTRIESDFDAEIDFDDFFDNTSLEALLGLLLDYKNNN